MSKTNKPYKTPDPEVSMVAEAAAAYDTPQKKVYYSREGIDPDFVLDLMASYQFSKQMISRLTDISTKTLDRHFHSGKAFTGLQSDRLLELAELYNEGIRTFGAQTKFLKWLDSRLPALGDTAPKEWLDTHHGIQMISDELGRIRHGIFA